MVEFIEQAVEEISKSPDSGEVVELILGVEESHMDDVREALGDLDVQEVEEGPFYTFKINVDESKVNSICEIEYLRDIELNSKGVILSQGN